MAVVSELVAAGVEVEEERRAFLAFSSISLMRASD
jgi:hypothetical protein